MADQQFMDRRIKQADRKQMVLKSVEVDKLVEEDHEVRAIWEMVKRLDLSSYYESIRAMEGSAGRSATDPVVLISLWIYAYSKGVSAAREIERLCEQDSAYQWITGLEVINYHTLSDFRIKNQEGLNKIFTDILGILSGEGLITLERVMHDGTKIKAYASGDTFRREERIQKHLEAAREQVRIMETTSEDEMSQRISKAKKRAIKEKKKSLEQALEELEKIKGNKKEKEKKEARVSMTDPEARIMKQSDGGYAPSFNVQISTDAKEKIIVGVRISQNGSDYGELIPAKEKIEENIGEFPKQMVVDGGFISRENILAMNGTGVELISGEKKEGNAQGKGQFEKRGIVPAFQPEAFGYDKENNTYSCPEEKVLKYSGKENRVGHINYEYSANINDCQFCLSKEKCCPANPVKGRTITRREEAAEIVAFREKMKREEIKAIYKQRGAVAEFPNAWIKSKIKLRQFRLKGLKKAGIEVLWACLTYNIQQWIRLSWKPKCAC